jgi:hypothetical protein
MPNDERVWPIERFIGGLDEIRTVLGADTGPTIEKIRHELICGIAHRDRGDRPAALVSIANAMGELAGLGDRLGGAEGAMMRAVTAAFLSGLASDDRDVVEKNLQVIQSKAGKPKKP